MHMAAQKLFFRLVENKQILILSYLVIFIGVTFMELNASEKATDSIVSNHKDVIIAPHTVRIPLENILLIRKESEYCALKFIPILMIFAM